jgi:hypothetical protein
LRQRLQAIEPLLDRKMAQARFVLGDEATGEMVEPVARSRPCRRPQHAVGPYPPTPRHERRLAAKAPPPAIDGGPQMRRPSREALFDPAPPEIVTAPQNGLRRLELL